MQITIKNRIAKVLAPELLKYHVEIDMEEKHSHRDFELELGSYTAGEIQAIAGIFETCGIQGTKVIAADIKKYLQASKEGINSITARTVRQSGWMLEHYFAELPHHLIFSEDDYKGGSYVGYYVNDVDFEPEKKGDRHSYAEPAHVTFNLIYIDCDVRCNRKVKLFAADVLNLTPRQILKRAGYVPESDERLAVLKEETERFFETCGKIGKKMTAKGVGLADLDDAAEKSEGYNFWRRNNELQLDAFGVDCHVVVDVLHEKDTNEERSNMPSESRVDPFRWHKWNLRFFTPAEDDLARHLEADEDTELAPDVQIPVHPLVPCFDLKRHTRLRAHINNLTPYVYRKEVADNLVLPERDIKMVNLLVDESQNTFKDVVTGKGASMNILSEGPPGTGKTVTAEVFAEFKERPLYSIQCSQLGMEPATVEKNLAVILTRANRWNAVLLLDEADVYIRKRGSNMKHNAIVGVFLRILEYASCILFMTTNLADNVDDAIASRCIVRIRYGAPGPDMQYRIWKNLARLNGIELEKGSVKQFVEAHPNISGRDVKNLLKLASFVAKADKKPIDYAALEFALQFKPTANTKDTPESTEED